MTSIALLRWDATAAMTRACREGTRGPARFRDDPSGRSAYATRTSASRAMSPCHDSPRSGPGAVTPYRVVASLNGPRLIVSGRPAGARRRCRRRTGSGAPKPTTDRRGWSARQVSCPPGKSRGGHTFDVEERWPELFAELDETQRRAVVRSLACLQALRERHPPRRRAAAVPRASVPCTDAVAALLLGITLSPAGLAWPLCARWIGPDAGSSGPSTPGPRRRRRLRRLRHHAGGARTHPRDVRLVAGCRRVWPLHVHDSDGALHAVRERLGVGFWMFAPVYREACSGPAVRSRQGSGQLLRPARAAGRGR